MLHMLVMDDNGCAPGPKRILYLLVVEEKENCIFSREGWTKMNVATLMAVGLFSEPDELSPN
jgi:hypothetical protein